MDPEDPAILTPTHALLGKTPLETPPPPSLSRNSEADCYCTVHNVSKKPKYIQWSLAKVLEVIPSTDF